MAEVRIDPLSGQRVFVATEAAVAAVQPVRAWALATNWLRPDSSRSSIGPRQPPEPTAQPDLFWAGAATGTHELLEVSEPVASLGAAFARASRRGDGGLA